MGQPPVTPYDTGAYGAWGATRKDSSQGSCGLGSYPCRHWGADIVGKPGGVILAPTNGWLLVSQKWDTNASPFGGYGPGVILFAHDDRAFLAAHDARDPGFDITHDVNVMKNALTTGQSIYYSLLGHVDPRNLAYDLPFKTHASEIYDASGSKSKHYRKARGADIALQDDAVRVDPWPSTAPYVTEGTPLGFITPGVNHVHWEVRNGPLGHFNDVGQTDPKKWLADETTGDPSIDWSHAPPSGMIAPTSLPPIASSGGGMGLALLIGGGLYLWSQEKGGRR